jgi:hypothetical protein
LTQVDSRLTGELTHALSTVADESEAASLSLIWAARGGSSFTAIF